MALFAETDANGNIVKVAEQPFDGCEEITCELISYRGRIYKEGTQPTPDAAEVASFKLAEIDADTSAAIVAGFDYDVDGVTYHFSYDQFDQQNFSDSANVATLAHIGVAGLQSSVYWNAYKNWANGTGELTRLTFTAETFLTLYTNGALKHKVECMEAGGIRKAAVRDALANGSAASVIKAI